MGLLNLIEQSESILMFLILFSFIINLVIIVRTAYNYYLQQQGQNNQFQYGNNDIELNLLGQQQKQFNLQKSEEQQKIIQNYVDYQEFNQKMEEFNKKLNFIQTTLKSENEKDKLLQVENKLDQKLNDQNQKIQKVMIELQTIQQNLNSIKNLQNIKSNQLQQSMKYEQETQVISNELEDQNRIPKANFCETFSKIEQLFHSHQMAKESLRKNQIAKIVIGKLFDETSKKRAVDLQFQSFVRQNEDQSTFFQNYSLSLQARKEMKKHCFTCKPVRGDGNCFYTAFGFQFFKHLLINTSQRQFDEFIEHCYKINLSMKLYLSEQEEFKELRDEIVQKDLLNDFIYRLIKLRDIENEQERFLNYEKQFAAYEYNNEEVDGCFQGLATIFLRNYSNYAVDFHEMKESLFDRQNLLIWEKECNSNEIVIDALARKLNMFVKLLHIENKNFTVNEYGLQNNRKIVLLFRPGHYNIGIVSSEDQPVEQKGFRSILDLSLQFFIPELKNSINKSEITIQNNQF